MRPALAVPTSFAITSGFLTLALGENGPNDPAGEVSVDLTNATAAGPGVKKSRLRKGWLETTSEIAEGRIRVVAGDGGVRFVLYAGERQNVPIVTHGPFVGDTRADLMRISRALVEARSPR